MAAYTTSTLSTLKNSRTDSVSKSDTHWLQVLSHISPQYGGIAASVPRLAKATEATSRHLCPILSFCSSTELTETPENQREGIRIFPSERLRWLVDRRLRHDLKSAIRAASGVHIHGVWETHCMIAAGVARECKRPYVISVHGMLEQWALQHKRLKKALYAALIEIRRMQRAACLRALSADEVQDYRRLGLSNPIAIIPNGIDTPPVVSADIFRNSYPELAGKRIVLFLGRLHQKKGLDILLTAWSKIASEREGVHLVIAGPDADNTRASLETLTDELKLRSVVTFTGMLEGEAKWSALAAANLFVLPSHSEGFSIAILEALSLGVPVIVTGECHIPEVAQHKCGWVVQPEVDSLTRAFNDFLRISTAELEATGSRGRDLARTRFHSSVVGAQMAELYDWLQGGNKPATVEIV